MCDFKFSFDNNINDSEYETQIWLVGQSYHSLTTSKPGNIQPAL